MHTNLQDWFTMVTQSQRRKCAEDAAHDRLKDSEEGLELTAVSHVTLCQEVNRSAEEGERVYDGSRGLR